MNFLHEYFFLEPGLAQNVFLLEGHAQSFWWVIAQTPQLSHQIVIVHH